MLFGFLSRRFETEADLVGMSLLPSDGEPRSRRFAATLLQVALLNRTPPDAGSWRHFSVARRGAFLLAVEADPALGSRFERRCTLLRVGCFLALALGLGVAAYLVRQQMRDLPRARQDWERMEMAVKGWDLVRLNQPAEAIPLLEESTRHPHARGELFLVLAEAYEQSGRLPEAFEARRKATERGCSDPRFRLKLK